MHTKYLSPLVLLVCLICLALIVACEKEGETTIIESGMKIEDFESDKLNALPIIGYMQTGSVLPPEIDGNGFEEIWTLTEPYEIVTEGGANGFGPTVTLKALYDNYYIFILATWEDSAQSVHKGVWWYGSPISGDTTYANEGAEYDWHQITEPYTGYIASLIRTVVDSSVVPPVTRYVYNYEPIDLSGNEDGLAILWNINSTNFLGCTSLCHGSSMATDVDEAADLWYWMAHRSNQKGYADDLSLQPAGFIGDSGDSLCFPNVDEGLPAVMDPMEPGRNLTFLHDSTTNLSFYATLPWEGGSRVPGYVLRWPSGSRANVKAVATHSEGKWTLEIRRELNSGDKTDTDIQFNPDAEANVDFHIAVYDNADGANHAYSFGTHVLHFLQYKE
jgi:hypothetical protein